MKDEEIEKFKKEIEKQKKMVDGKINPIMQSYEDGKLTKREFVEKLADAFMN